MSSREEYLRKLKDSMKLFRKSARPESGQATTTEEHREASTFCTECGRSHSFPVPKFHAGQQVLLARTGNNHSDRIGEVTTVRGVWKLLAMPCDEVEYVTDLGEGSVLESRLEATP